MPRAKNKSELLESAKTEFAKLFAFIDTLSPHEQESPFLNTLKNNARDKNIRDILVHLYEWHNLVLDFTRNITRNEPLSFFPRGFNWRTYPKLNLEFHAKHQSTSLESAKALLNKSHADMMDCVKRLSDEELFTKNIFAWCGNTTLGSYFISSMTSHYIWAIKMLKEGFKKK